MTTIDKATDVLRALGASAPDGQLATLEQVTGIPRPTLYRMLRTLIERNVVQQDAAGNYRVGPKVFSLAADAFAQFGVGDGVRQVMVDLGRQVHLAIHVSTFRAEQLVYIDKLDADTPFQMRSEIGRLQAIHSSAIGRSVLAHLDEHKARRILSTRALERFTPYTVVDIERILAKLPEIKSWGYASDNEEDELSTRAIGAPILDAEGAPVGGISIVAPSFEISMEALQRHTIALREAASTISARLSNESQHALAGLAH